MLSRVRLFATLGTVACQAPLFVEILQARTLKWVVMPSSRASSQPRDQTRVSSTAGILYHLSQHGVVNRYKTSTRQFDSMYGKIKIYILNLTTPLLGVSSNKISKGLQISKVYKDVHYSIVYKGQATEIVYLPVKERQWHPTPVLLPGKSHGWRSLVGCSPWGR